MSGSVVLLDKATGAKRGYSESEAFDALTSGSAARGAEVALAFGVGTVPLLWVAQHGFHRLRRKLTPVALGRFQRGLALVTAVILAWRLHDTLPFGHEEIVQEKKELPSCCH